MLHRFASDEDTTSLPKARTQEVGLFACEIYEDVAPRIETEFDVAPKFGIDFFHRGVPGAGYGAGGDFLTTARSISVG